MPGFKFARSLTMTPSMRGTSDAVTNTGSAVGHGPHALMARLNNTNVRTRLLILAGVLAVIWVVANLVTATGLLSTKSSAHKATSAFNSFRTERDAYEGWLTQDDQSNMASSLASLHERSQQALLNATWQQVIQGHQQAVANLHLLARPSEDAPPRPHLVAVTQHDLAGYSAFTVQVGQAIQDGRTRYAIYLMSVKNANISNKTQADFNALSAVFTHQASVVRAQVDSTVNQDAAAR